MTKKKKKKTVRRQGEGAEKMGRERGRSVWRTEAGKEEMENETRRPEDLPSALSAVNYAHVVNSLLSQAQLLFNLRRDRSTVRHLRGSLAGPLKNPHVGLEDGRGTVSS